MKCFATKWHVIALEDYEVKNIKLIKIIIENGKKSKNKKRK